MKPHANTLLVFLLLYWLFFDGPATSSLTLTPETDSVPDSFLFSPYIVSLWVLNFPSWLYYHLLMTPKSRFLTQISFFEIIPWKFPFGSARTLYSTWSKLNSSHPHTWSSFGVFSLLFIFQLSECEILVPQTEIEPQPPAVKVQSLTHWTTMGSPLCFLSW